MPTGDEYRHLAGVFTGEEARLRDIAAELPTVVDPTVFDGVMQSSFLEFTSDETVVACRSAADRCSWLAGECRRRAVVADAWAGAYREYDRALGVWRVNVERSGVGARPQPPARPAPWVDH